jgi:hypothetical protein
VKLLDVKHAALVHVRRVTISEYADQPIPLIQAKPAFRLGLYVSTVPDSVYLNHNCVRDDRPTVIEEEPILSVGSLFFQAASRPGPANGTGVKHAGRTSRSRRQHSGGPSHTT